MNRIAFAASSLLAFSAALPTAMLPAAVLAQELAQQLAPADQKEICYDRPTCKIISVTDAGKGEKGERLQIVDIVLGKEDLPAYFPEEGCMSTDEALEGGEEKRDGGREIWLVAESAKPVKLLPLCNDGYGAAGVGSDEIGIGDNRLTHTQSGGSAWRWDFSKTFQLSPLRLIAETSCSYHDAAPNTGELMSVDRTTLEARAYAPAPRDDWSNAEIGCPEIVADFTKPLVPEPAPQIVAGYAVPMPFDVDAPPLAVGTTLGSCSLSLTSDGGKGFLIYGEPAAADEAAELRVIAETTKSVLIQVRDPLAAAAIKAAAGASWIKAPHVEIWTATEGEPPEGDDFVAPPRLYHQIGISLDGKVEKGTGKPENLPQVATWAGKDEKGRDVTLLRLTWEDESATLYGLGVVYSQAKDGKQVRLVANAPIKKNKPLFLPSIWHNSQDESGAPGGACELSGETKQLDL